MLQTQSLRRETQLLGEKLARLSSAEKITSSRTPFGSIDNLGRPFIFFTFFYFISIGPNLDSEQLNVENRKKKIN